MGTSTLRSPGIPDSQWIRVSPWRMGLPAGPPSVADFPLVLLVMTFGCLRSAPRQSFVPGLPTAAPSPSGPRRQTSRGRSRPCSATSTVPCSGGSARAARSPPDRLGADSALGDSSPLGFNEAASRGQRIPAFDVLNPAGANENFNEAASRGPADTLDVSQDDRRVPDFFGFNEAASRGQRIRWSVSVKPPPTEPDFFNTSMRPPAVASGYGPTASTRHGSACASFCERCLITTIPGLWQALQHAAGAVTTSALARRRRALPLQGLCAWNSPPPAWLSRPSMSGPRMAVAK